MTILLTFDVEDWFQVENFKEHITYASWAEQELRVMHNTFDLLDLLDAASLKRKNVLGPVRATFFILGWIAEKCPDLVREVVLRGHEVASHGYWHHPCYAQSPSELLEDLQASKRILEEISQRQVVGYRAPSFSISDEVVALVKEAGYLYDSSYNSYGGHGRYGSMSLPEPEDGPLPLYALPGPFYEIPLSNLYIGKTIIPWAGGGYFRLLPFMLYNLGMKRVLEQQGCFCFYMHPWEIDPEQPRVVTAKASYRFRHYINLGMTRKKLEKLLTAHLQSRFLTCVDYVEESLRDSLNTGCQV